MPLPTCSSYVALTFPRRKTVFQLFFSWPFTIAGFHMTSQKFSSIFAQLLKLSQLLQYANHRCAGHTATCMSTEHGNDRLITAHALSCYLHTDHLRIPQQYFVSLATIDLTLWIHRTKDELKLQRDCQQEGACTVISRSFHVRSK